jgi:methionyl aminopeptidase
MINLKTSREIGIMKSASRIVAEVLAELREIVREGMTTAEIDRLASEMTLKRKAKPAFKGYRGFPSSICVSLNEEVVHGIPSPKSCGAARRQSLGRFSGGSDFGRSPWIRHRA